MAVWGDAVCSGGADAYSFTFGDWNATVLRDGTFKDVAPILLVPFFVALRVWQHYYPGTTPTASLNPLLLRGRSDVVLFDSGTGAAPGTGMLLGLLDDVGVRPEDVTRVLVTHAHFDHMGGLLSATGGRAFPNAVAYLGVEEYAFWTRPLVELHLPQDLVNGTHALLRAVINAYGADLRRLNDLESPIGGIQALRTPGHTPGHMVYRVTSAGKSMVVSGDAQTSRLSTIQNPEWNIFSDTNRTQAVRSRIEFMEMVTNNSELTLLFHETFPGLGYGVQNGAYFDFSPAALFQ